MGGCNGGYLGPTWNWMQGGICTGGLYEGTGCKPYTIAPCEHHTTGDRPDCSDLPNSKTPSCTNDCADSYSGPSYMNDKVSFTVYEDFMTYTGGVYYHTTGRSLGGHAIKLMGWGVDADTGMDYWLLVNSWNDDWGENGWFRMRRGTNECGLENSGVAGTIKV